MEEARDRLVNVALDVEWMLRPFSTPERFRLPMHRLRGAAEAYRRAAVDLEDTVTTRPEPYDGKSEALGRDQ
jgi:hypothetical protein